MQLFGLNTFHRPMLALAVALLLTPPLAAQAQQPRETLDRENYYRAEIVIVERKVDPSAVTERMASREAEPVTEIETRLWSVDQDGNPGTTLELVPRAELHLKSTADRLEGSGRYRVLLAAGWYQSYPPDYKGEPLHVAIGDWLEEAGHREIEGHITIDRQRYLHVGVNLNHWQPRPASHQDARSLYEDSTGEGNTLEAWRDDDDDGSLAALAQGGDIDQDPLAAPVAPEHNAELLTWIRETRRMRSEEVHFLDSPTISVLVFFKRIEN